MATVDRRQRHGERPGTAGEVSGLVSDRVLHSRAEAEAYVASVCFKHGPPRLVGVELEWTVHHAEDSASPLDPGRLAAALGSHAPTTFRPASPQRPLPRGGVVTLEPGGQVEISFPPRASLPGMLADLAADAHELAAMLSAEGLVLGSQGTDPYRIPRRLLATPRYRAMEEAFAPIGPDGLTMMCSTAGVQVCLDAGEASDVADRWAALHELGPVLCALFGNSSQLSGRHTPWVSARQRVLFGTDPARMRPAAAGADPARSWARRALDATVICVRAPGENWRPERRMSFAEWVGGALPRPPTVADLDYHLSTMFPPVRPRGYLEVRYLDTQPGASWVRPVVLLASLMANPHIVDRLREAVEPARGRWLHAARYGLGDRRIARAATAVVDLAVSVLPDTGVPQPLASAVLDAASRRVDAPTEPIAEMQRWYA
jgi:glutamate--cysteine ligase